MILHQAALVDFAGAIKIAANEVDEVVQLYDSRDGREKEGTFFLPAQVTEGIYFGIRHNGQLVAAAGTHLINKTEGIAAIGNVYCLPSYRGKGFGAGVTSAVINALLKDGLKTVGLNVSPENPAANLYHRLGFRKACLYIEGTAEEKIHHKDTKDTKKDQPQICGSSSSRSS
jgi:predicted GNAT family acetyltransferase